MKMKLNIRHFIEKFYPRLEKSLKLGNRSGNDQRSVLPRRLNVRPAGADLDRRTLEDRRKASERRTYWQRTSMWKSAYMR